MNYLAVGYLSDVDTNEEMTSGQPMEKSALLGISAGALGTAGWALAKYALLGTALGAGSKVAAPALERGYRSVAGPSEEHKAKMDMLKARQKGYQEQSRLPYTLGGAGIGGTLGYGLSGGSGWGTGLGALAGGYLGREHGKDIYNWAKNRLGGASTSGSDSDYDKLEDYGE